MTAAEFTEIVKASVKISEAAIAFGRKLEDVRMSDYQSQAYATIMMLFNQNITALSDLNNMVGRNEFNIGV